MLEKRFNAVPPQAFTADGTAAGVVTIANDACTLFKVKQHVIISANTLPNLVLEVKEIDNSGNIQVGPIPGKPGGNINIDSRTDVSAYTVTLSAKISANQQKRPSIDWAEAMRAMYDEEPAVAMRSILVDDCGNKFSVANPIPVAFDGTISIGAVEITDGTDTLDVNPDGSINVNIVNSTPASTPGLNIIHNEITLIAASVETTIVSLIAPPGGYRIQKVEVSGDNTAIFRVKVNGATISDRRSWWCDFNQEFDFEDFTNGLLLTSGQTLTVTVVHTRPFVGAFEATVMYLS